MTNRNQRTKLMILLVALVSATLLAPVFDLIGWEQAGIIVTLILISSIRWLLPEML